MPMPVPASHKNPFCPMISITARSASARLRAAQAGNPERIRRNPRLVPSRRLAPRARACEDEAAKYEGKLRSFVSASVRASAHADDAK